MYLRKPYLALTCTLMMLCSATSCNHIKNSGCTATGPVVTRTENLTSDISRIETSMGLNVTYTQSDSAFFTIAAPSDIMEYIIAEQDNGTLTFRSSKSLNYCAYTVNITVKAPGVSNFKASSGASISVNDPYLYKQKNVTTQASSGAAITFGNIMSGGVIAQASSGAIITLSGNCKQVSLSASSGAVISAVKLKAQTGDASASSGGSIHSHILRTSSFSESSGGCVNNLN